MSRGGHLAIGGKVDDVSLDFGNAHFGRVAFVVVEDVSAAPFHIGFFSTGRIVFGADGVTKLIEKFFSLCPIGMLREGGCRFLWRGGRF